MFRLVLLFGVCHTIGDYCRGAVRQLPVTQSVFYLVLKVPSGIIHTSHSTELGSHHGSYGALFPNRDTGSTPSYLFTVYQIKKLIIFFGQLVKNLIRFKCQTDLCQILLKPYLRLFYHVVSLATPPEKWLATAQIGIAMANGGIHHSHSLRELRLTLVGIPCLIPKELIDIPDAVLYIFHSGTVAAVPFGIYKLKVFILPDAKLQVSLLVFLQMYLVSMGEHICNAQVLCL